MAWSVLAQQFCLELGFGVLFALAFVPRAPVGAFFYRLMGSAAALPLALGGVARWRMGGGVTDPAVWTLIAALAAYPIYSGPWTTRRWPIGIAIGLTGSSAATATLVCESVAVLSPFGRVLAVLSALTTGAVAGSVGLAMVLGHWYLTVPKLEIRYLRRLNRVTVGSMIASIGLCGASCLYFADSLGGAEPSLFGPTGLFYLGTRLAIGLAVPLVFAAMAASSLRFQNTRSATGILYASTVLVLIGTAASIFLQDSYRVPL